LAKEAQQIRLSTISYLDIIWKQFPKKMSGEKGREQDKGQLFAKS